MDMSQCEITHPLNNQHKVVHQKILNCGMYESIFLLKGHCIEFKYYADGVHSDLTPPG